LKIPKEKTETGKRRTDNTMDKTKDRQYNGQNEGQTIQWPKRRTDNTMAKTQTKDRQYNGQNKKEKFLNDTNIM
jgi:hypothetical protein